MTSMSIDVLCTCEYDVGRKYIKILGYKLMSELFITFFLFSNFSTINTYCFYYLKRLIKTECQVSLLLWRPNFKCPHLLLLGI